MAEPNIDAGARHDHAVLMESLTLAFRQFALIAAHISDADVKKSSSAVATADAIGFVVDPTMYRDALASGSLKRQRELIALFTHTKARLQLLFPADWPA